MEAVRISAGVHRGCVLTQSGRPHGWCSTDQQHTTSWMSFLVCFETWPAGTVYGFSHVERRDVMCCDVRDLECTYASA